MQTVVVGVVAWPGILYGAGECIDNNKNYTLNVSEIVLVYIKV